MKKIIICFILLVLVSGYSHAQNGRIFSADSELSSSLINDVHQDSKGYIWIATEDGLSKYDGAKFTLYKQDKGDTTSILNNYVKTIFEDHNNNLFFGYFNGLQIYDHASDTFKRIPLSKSKDFIHDAHVTTILERENGEILVGTSGRGIFELKRKNDSIYAENLENLVSTGFIDKLFEDSYNNLWIITHENGLYLIDNAQKNTHYFQDKTQRATISTICENARGQLFVGSHGEGLFEFNKQDSSFIPIPKTEKLAIHSLYPTSKDEILVGTDGNGLFILDPVTLALEPSQISVANFDFSKSKVHNIMEDRSGNIWLGLYQKGVVLIPNRINNFNYIGYQSNYSDIIGSNCVMAVYKDHDGILWVGTDGDGLYSISPSNKVLTHYKDQEYLNGRLKTVVTIYEDSNQELWIGTYLNGLARIERETQKAVFIEDFVDEQSNPVENIFSIIEDNKKNLWVGTMGSGLFQLDLKTKTVQSYNVVIADAPKGPTFFNNKWINKLLLDETENRLYVGSYDGLSCFDLSTKKFILFENGIRQLGGQIVYTLHKDDAGFLWVGTANGLIKMDKDFNEKAFYTIDDGLPSNMICSIEKDSKGNFWISTNKGISEFDVDKQNFINYYFNDGLQGNEFSKNASYLSKESQIYFGGMNGITYFKPSEILDKAKKPDILITDIYLQNTPIRKGMTSGSYDILNKAVTDADSIELAYKDNSFSLEFSSLEYSNPQRISYSYSVNDSPWINLRQGVNNVAFDNLEAGTYTFKVRAKDYDKFSDIKELTAVIHPLWYFSTQAKLAYALLFLVVLALVIHQLRQRQLTKNRIREYSKAKQINEAKLQFLTNISHDIKTPITLIINPLKKLINSDSDPLRQKSYRTMFRNTDRILQLTNQLLDVRKIDRGQIELKFEEVELVQYIKEICFLFEDQIEVKKIDFDFKHDMPELLVWIDPNYFDKVIQNLLANAIKFVPEGGDVQLVLDLVFSEKDTHKQPYFQITVIDNGIGIEKDKEHRIFDRFYQSKGTPHHREGTGIGLHLTRSIAQLHHGTVYAQNNENGKGSRFILRVPLGSQHLSTNELQTHVPKKSFELEEPALLKKEIETEEPEENTLYGRSKVVVVDDDAEIRQYIKKELYTTFDILLAENGKEAMPLIIKEEPELVISDIMMPEIDGIELCRLIKKNININHIPVILLTAQSNQEINIKGLNTGADAYISKPFSLEILKKTALNLIQNRKLLKNNYDGSQSQEDKIEQLEIKSADEIFLKKVMAHINKNLSNPDLNVEMIASTIGISRVHLYRKLKELTNQSASDLIKNTRLKQAADLLRSKQISISEVAYATGFSNSSTFSTSFKKFYGDSPKKYQEKHLVN